MSFRFAPSVIAVLSALALSACSGGATTSSTRSARAPTSPATSSTVSSAPAGGQSPQIGFEGVQVESGPQIGPAGTTGTATIDGIRCGATEQLAYHIHAHLAVYVDGRLNSLPGGIGIPGSVAEATSQGPVASGGRCIYWLHTHSSDGIIHVESPTQRIYTLGNFFDEWHQPLSAGRIGDVSGKITAFVNGSPWTRSVRAIPLIPHVVIQLSVGLPAPPPMAVDWARTGL